MQTRDKDKVFSILVLSMFVVFIVSCALILATQFYLI